MAQINLHVPDYWLELIEVASLKAGYKNRTAYIKAAVEHFAKIPKLQPSGGPLEATMDRETWTKEYKRVVCPDCSGEFGTPIQHCGGGERLTSYDERNKIRNVWLCVCPTCAAAKEAV